MACGTPLGNKNPDCDESSLTAIRANGISLNQAAMLATDQYQGLRGVYKTTSAFAIGLILATEMNKKVLYVDLDDQANLTQAAMRSKKFPSPNISDHFADYSSYPLGSLIQSTRFNNAWIIPSAPDLRLTLSTTVDWTESEQRFTNLLHHDSVVIPNGGGDFDWIIIDTPPALSLYTRSALIASHFVLAPFTPSALDEVGLQNLLETLTEVRGIASAGNQTRMLGCFATRWRRTATTASFAANMRDVAYAANAPMLETDIGEDANLVRKLVNPEGVPNLSRVHGAFDDYRQLVKEIQNYVGDN